MSKEISRRDFLKSSAIIAVGVAAPPWLASIAKADVLKLARGGVLDPDNILVVCQLSGGNDGLNTVIPWSNADYYRYRPTLAIPEAQVLKLNETLGLHPSLAGFEKLYKAGNLAVVQNVGYPNPNRSHFRSMEIWQTANPDMPEQYGWLGKFLDDQGQKGSTNPVMAIELGRTKSAAVRAKTASVPCFASLADVKALVGDEDAERFLREIQGMGGGADQASVRQATNAALDAMAELNKSIDKHQSKFTYSPDAFGQGFKQIAQLIATSPKTRVIYFSGGGFDTHSQQASDHTRLLNGLGDALSTFMDEMKAIGKSDKVTVMVFSEFGRRVGENNSQGTDHGAAAPMFVVGGKVKGCLIGDAPDLTQLERGDLKWKTDFREVYATLLDEWMGAESAAIFGKKFGHVKVF
ncbi:MAG: DUF1501 domain-containing protein [Armatimonadota bacterium]|nr:DUF1501 domain-containing protein [Armatimonadota bacterium]